MSKELINKIEKVFKDSTYCGWGSVLEELKQALTPPTQEDVCKALNEYINGKVFISTNNMICIRHKEYDVNIDFFDDEIDFDGLTLPPHLITLIGRFYENLEANNE
jgi:hypothetical protein